MSFQAGGVENFRTLDPVRKDLGEKFQINVIISLDYVFLPFANKNLQAENEHDTFSFNIHHKYVKGQRCHATADITTNPSGCNRN